MNVYVFMIQSNMLATPLWRRFMIPQDMSFADLDAVIEIMLGYHQKHSHEFIFAPIKTRITNDEDSLGRSTYLHSEAGRAYLEKVDQARFEVDLSVTVLPSHAIPLKRLLDEIEEFQYVYDFEDQWVYDLTVIDAFDAETAEGPLVLDGLGTAPFEDCGGLEGYEALLATLTAGEADNERLRQWLNEQGHVFFDKADVNVALQTWFEQKVKADNS